MSLIKFINGDLTPEHQRIVNEGFAKHTEHHNAPPFNKECFCWLAYEDNTLVGALTAEFLWNWIYVDELWVNEALRGQGIGKSLMKEVEGYAILHKLKGLWLWTQSWQAADFYRKLGYQEFTRFPDFPRGHFRIGFRKELFLDE